MKRRHGRSIAAASSHRAARAVRHLQLPGRVRGARAPAARACGPTSRCCSSTRCTTSPRRTLPRRARGSVGTQPGDAPGRGTVARTLAREHAGLLRAAQGRTALRGARGLRHLVHRTAPRTIAVARESGRKSSRSPADGGQTLRKVSPLARWTTQTSGATRRRTTSRCCRSTIAATPASAASRARRCRSIRPTSAPAGGAARSSSAGFTFRRSIDDGNSRASSSANCPDRSLGGRRLRCWALAALA